MDYRLRYPMGELVLHRRVDANMEVDNEKETREMELESMSAGTLGPV